MRNMAMQQTLGQAMEHHRAGRLREAEGLYRAILAEHPDHADALHLLGMVAFQAGQLEPASQLVARAITVNSSPANFHRSMGQILSAMGRLENAIAAFHEALLRDPKSADACNDLGIVLLRLGRLGEAAEVLRRAVELRPAFPEAAANLANVLHQSGDTDSAIAIYRDVLKQRPMMLDARYALANVLQAAGRLDEAIAEFEMVLAQRPQSADARMNYAIALRENGRFDDAIAASRKAVAQAPDHALAHANLGLMLLLKGDFENGWSEYDWRGRIPRDAAIHQQFAQPRWGGGELDGRRILLHAEQGFGDTIQFCRYARLVAEHGGRVILQCPPELAGLMNGIAGVEQVVEFGAALPDFDLHCPLLSVPAVFRTTLVSIPANVPYLSADQAKVEQWRQTVGGEAAGMKIGLVWAGSSANRQDRSRSLTLQQVKAILQVSGARFFSLQLGEAAQQLSEAPAGMHMIDCASRLTDFSQTAALLMNLDLLITVDTAAAHLAGALARPVWVLLAHNPDWRWMLDRLDSPWYPTMKLFRQPARGDWNAPLAQVAAQLAEMAAARK